jgi:transposase InsO family protein
MQMQNGFVETFNRRTRDERLNEHLFTNHGNTNRPHFSLNGLAPIERPDQWHNRNRLSL